ncbi:MAG: tyrosine recombinase [Flavobacteriales bacterium]
MLSVIHEFEYYLKVERALSENSIKSYMYDLSKLQDFIEENNEGSSISELNTVLLKDFIYQYAQVLSPRSLARLISSLKAFYDYLVFNDDIETSPMVSIDSPKFLKKMPSFLELEEIDAIVDAVEQNDPHYFRNKAILETLYSCGLRVSELCDIQLNRVFFNEDFIQILGKGNKERLVPLGHDLKNYLQLYLSNERSYISSKKACMSNLFLNNRGNRLSRVMVFNVVKKHAKLAGLSSDISPHSFRHSFASHMIENGADLRLVQDLLGHESILTTEMYTHLSQSFIKEEVLSKHPRNLKKK